MKLRNRLKNRDRVVVVVSMASTLLLAGAFDSTARACSQIAPGIFSRTVWPAEPEPLPTNARPVVTYLVAGPLEIAALGDDLALLDADGTEVEASIVGDGSHFQIRPTAPLLPNHGYQIADRRAVPCGAGQVTCEQSLGPQAFASFTTGAGPDTNAPAFAGVSSIAAADHLTCDNGACCGSYDVHLVNVSWPPASDDVANADVRYNVYRREGTSLKLVAGFVQGTEMIGVRTCSGTWGAPEVKPGFYVVRAVDGAGNEDSNTIERQVGELCSSGCSVGGGGPPGWPLASLAALLLAGAVGRRSGPVLRARRRPPSR
jgi:hypothetical protein